MADLPAHFAGHDPTVSPTLPGDSSNTSHGGVGYLEFSRDPRHVSPPFPEGYWPTTDAPPDDNAWDASLAAFRADLAAMQKLVADPNTDLFAPIPHGDGQTILRETLLVADHNAYHLGQLVVVRRALGAWPHD